MKRAFKKLKAFVRGAVPTFSMTKHKHVLATIEERCTKRRHTLLYLADHVPCDECIITVISDAYGIPRKMLDVVEKRPYVRDVGCCKRKGKRGTWGIKKLTRIVHKRIFNPKLKD